MTVVAVTGAGGFVGSHFCGAANRAGMEVRFVPRMSAGRQDLEPWLRGVDAVVHLAARAHRRRGDTDHLDELFQADNVELTGQIGAACKAMHVHRLIFVSSAGVLGRSSPPEGFSDRSLPAPYDAYTRSKLAAEQMLQEQFADCLDIVIIRPPLVYGPGAKGSFSKLMKLAMSGLPLPLGAMTAPRSLMSVRNLCDLLLRVTRSQDVSGRCLLAADAEVTSIADLVVAMRAAAGRRPRLFRMPAAGVAFALSVVGRRDVYPSLAMPFVIRASSALAQLDWMPPFRLLDEIRWTVAGDASAGGRS